MKRNFDNKTLAIHYLLSNVTHNFSPNILSREEELALSYTLGQHVTHDTTRNAIITEFETFYHGLLKDISHTSEE